MMEKGVINNKYYIMIGTGVKKSKDNNWECIPLIYNKKYC
jgi:hypothetical protein